MAEKLYHSTVPIPSARRTAAQINPGVARMTGGQGLREIGKAMFSVGLQMHQVNVARQVADAMGKYKMAEANFMFEMMNADPSKTDYDQKWGEFIASQGELATGVSRDAGNIINNKMKLMQSSDYKSLKRMEISNTRALVMNELPGVMDSLLREQVKAEMDGDFLRAEQAKENMVQYLQGVAPALRPGEGGKMVRMYDAALDKARTDEEKQRFVAQVIADPVAAEKLIPDLKYQTPEQALSLRSMARGQQGARNKMSRQQKAAYKDKQSKGMLDQYLSGDSIIPPEDLHPELQPTIDAINNNMAGDVSNALREELPPAYYQLQEKVDAMTPISDTEMLDAAVVIPKQQIVELQKGNDINRKLRPRKKEVQSIIRQVNSGFDKLEDIAIEMEDSQVTPILLRELKEERSLVIKEMKGRLLKGESRTDVIVAANNIFEGTKKGILENGWNRFWKSKSHEFIDELESPEASAQQRRRAIINLMVSGKYEREIEAAIESGWFNE